MTLDLSSVLAAALVPLAGALAGVLVAWGRTQARLRALEKRCEELGGLDKAVTKLEQQLNDARGDQGRRIGDVEDRVAMLRGQFDGFDRGRRSRTAAHGVPGKDGE